MRERKSGRKEATQRMSFSHAGHDRCAGPAKQRGGRSLNPPRGLQGRMAQSCGARPHGAAASMQAAAPSPAAGTHKSSQQVVASIIATPEAS
jgi:hypothetical protein